MPGKKIIGLLCLSCLFSTACERAVTRPNLEELRIVDGDREKAVYQVEVAADNASRRRGLMYRESTAPDQGMLLSFRRSGRMAVWMKNTYIPLDIIFINVKGMIVKIHEGAEPLSTKRIVSDGKVKAVLEINAGQVKAHGIQPGDQVWHRSFRHK